MSQILPHHTISEIPQNIYITQQMINRETHISLKFQTYKPRHIYITQQIPKQYVKRRRAGGSGELVGTWWQWQVASWRQW